MAVSMLACLVRPPIPLANAVISELQTTLSIHLFA
jgi:hypothetical protein